MEVSQYSYTVRGRHVAMYTQVTVRFAEGSRVIRFMDKLSKRAAIENTRYQIARNGLAAFVA